MGQNLGITIFGITIFPDTKTAGEGDRSAITLFLSLSILLCYYNDGNVVDRAQNISFYNDKINITDHSDLYFGNEHLMSCTKQ